MTGNRIVLGTTKLGLAGRQSAFEMLDTFVELGGRHIDTAHVYSDWVPGERGRAETVLGEWLKARGNRNELVITTKGAHPPRDNITAFRSDRTNIRRDCEESRKRLGIEQVDLYYLHRDDLTRSVTEVVETLEELRREGKIKDYGGSNWQPPRIAEAIALQPAHFVASQILGNAFTALMNPDSDPTLAVLDTAAFKQAVAKNLRLDLFTSQAQGFMIKRKRRAPPPRNYDNPACDAAARNVEAIAMREGIDANDLTLAYLQALAPNVWPVIGPHDAQQLRESYRAGDIRLAPDVVREIAAATGQADFFAQP
jgi:aryl-alcohol dehydrogenase-like predicted oxidoreductase